MEQQYLSKIWGPVFGPMMLEDIGCLVSGNDEDRDQYCHREVVRSC
jgi:hypothetical protein